MVVQKPYIVKYMFNLNSFIGAGSVISGWLQLIRYESSSGMKVVNLDHK